MRETEIKFLLNDLSPYRKRAVEGGAQRIERFFEENILFDDEKGTLSKEWCILRLRKSNRNILTYKKLLGKDTFKIMEEHETEVSDYDETLVLLTHLGYRKVFRYQKRREIFGFEEGLICFDETPIGNYIEIEAEKPSIKKIASILHLNMSQAISKTYIELYREYREKHPEAPSDMLF